MFFVGRLSQNIFCLVPLTTNHILSGNTVTFSSYHRWVRAKVAVSLWFGLKTSRIHLVAQADRCCSEVPDAGPWCCWMSWAEQQDHLMRPFPLVHCWRPQSCSKNKGLVAVLVFLLFFPGGALEAFGWYRWPLTFISSSRVMKESSRCSGFQLANCSMKNNGSWNFKDPPDCCIK